MVTWLETLFPRLPTAAYRVSSPVSRDYNCIAWAAGDTSRWWWPTNDPDNDVPYWPAGVAREETVAAFIAVFATLGYRVGDSETWEPGFDKVALFADAQGIPTHAARQLPQGRWTSKLGLSEDIEHDLHDVSGAIYGVVVRVWRRPISTPIPG
jgi:hypothetical protein